MGCGGSAPVASVDVAQDIQTTDKHGVSYVEKGITRQQSAKQKLVVAELDATKTKPGNTTFISSVLNARAECADDPSVMADCCSRLQAHNRRIKQYVAIYDCQTVKEALSGGFLGLGVNDNKLIAALCTRTKSQLLRARKQYRELYDQDMRLAVKEETSGVVLTGAYARLTYFAMAAPDEYIANIIDLACGGSAVAYDTGCDETALLEVFVIHTQAELQAGKKKWEGAKDTSLIDHLNKKVTSSYRHLRRLLFHLLKGDRNESENVDEALATEQVLALHDECEKGWFEDFDEPQIIEIIGGNSTTQNQRVATLYENEYNVSLSKALKGKCGDRLHYCLAALLLTKPDFIAMRLHDAMDQWSTDQKILTRLLGGLDGQKMMGVVSAYEQKYNQPLWSAFKNNVSGDFERAGLTWIRALEEPSRGAEEFTEVAVESLTGDAPKLANMLDWLLLEHEALSVFIAYLDVESIREACKGWGTDDTQLIRSLATRSKRALARVNIGYREAYGDPLQALIDSELGHKSWYSYLAKFLVVQEEQADSMILDLAMDGPTVDHAALVEFLCARHPKRVRAAKERWEQSHDDSLVDKLADSLSGDMRTLALRMLRGKRDLDTDASSVDDKLAKKQANVLHDGNADYIEVLCDNSPAQNAKVAHHFEDTYGSSLRRGITQEYSGPVKNALLALLSGPAEWYAAQLKAALVGVETNDKAICRIVGAHDKDEIKQIAAAYDKKYGVALKTAISQGCSGNYKRLAVAWVDLIDQLEQPEMKVEVPTKAEVPDEGTVTGDARVAANVMVDDDEISENDEEPEEAPDISSALYKAKVAQWTAKYNKYHGMGKKHKMDYYQRLLLLYPPVKRGDKLLKGFAEALEAEYKGGEQQADDWTMMWFNTVAEDDFAAAGIGKDMFKEWLDTQESMVQERRVTPSELKGHWGLNAPPVAKPVAYQVPQAMPMIAPPMPMMAPMPMAQPMMAPQPMMMPMAQPMMMPAAMPAIGMGAPMYGGTAMYTPMMGTTTTTTTTSCSSSTTTTYMR